MVCVMWEIIYSECRVLSLVTLLGKRRCTPSQCKKTNQTLEQYIRTIRGASNAFISQNFTLFTISMFHILYLVHAGSKKLVVEAHFYPLRTTYLQKEFTCQTRLLKSMFGLQLHCGSSRCDNSAEAHLPVMFSHQCL